MTAECPDFTLYSRWRRWVSRCCYCLCFKQILQMWSIKSTQEKDASDGSWPEGGIGSRTTCIFGLGTPPPSHLQRISLQMSHSEHHLTIASSAESPSFCCSVMSNTSKSEKHSVFKSHHRTNFTQTSLSLLDYRCVALQSQMSNCVCGKFKLLFYAKWSSLCFDT